MHQNDLQLTQEDIGQLENVEQVIHFFATLGYDVDDAIPLTHTALGMDSDDLRQQIKRIHRLASDPDQELIIYLFELRSVNVALTQTIARRFRERTEETMLVLTKDYEQLDFVLLDREIARGKTLGKALKQIIRPRSLTINRRNPDEVAKRVLKRFTFTEADGVYQWDKLRAAYDVAEWAEPEFNNRALFSDYYLKHRLTDPKLTPAWAEDVRPIGRRLHQHLSQARQRFTQRPEEVVRAELYEPLFRELGFDFVAHKAGTSDTEEPDYKLYSPGNREKPVALALTYVWNRNLDGPDPERDPDTGEEIPGALVVSVLEKAEAPWVIMTNGKLWRLYSATASNKATNYYEIDLEEALAAPDQTIALKYWWLLFRHDAFTGFLDHLLQQSADYAKALGDRLKERVFTEIFPHFAAGFIAQMRAEWDKPQANFSDEALQVVYEGTLTFLYRLMFVLYAESLELLPLYEERGYRPLSLHAMKHEIAARAGVIQDEAPEKLKKAYRADSIDLYERLLALFNLIDTGSDAHNLPTYNGGLFSQTNDNGEFLADYAIPDRYLALGLDRLCRDVDDKTQALAFIDYKSLGVRQLGSIYEGLLEFKLRIAPEKLAVIKEKGKEVYVPLAEAGSRRVQATLAKGDVYLENDKRERKATGSYYTPDYIVKYIVEHTVGPVLERKFEELRPRLREAQRQYRQHKEKVAARGNDQSPELFWHSEMMRQLADDCLNVRVLDPAMGSGHFLVEAVDFVSNRLIDFLNGWSENPVWALLNRTRDDILEEMERQRVTIDANKLTRVALLKRAVLKRCVYGVDLNEMAVELAKVSLWLDAFTLGAPLSFLKHHLKHGNSLIGARVQEVRDALQAKPGQQMSLLAQSKFTGMMLATELMRQVSYLSDNTVSQVQESEQAYEGARDHLAPFKRVLDVYTSRWFGNQPHKGGFEPVIEFLKRDDTQAWIENPKKAQLPEKDYMNVRQVAETAAGAAGDMRFFHWELEFPEVYFAPNRPGGQDVDLLKDGGFDAIVGNPPYGALADLKLITDYFPTTVENNDIYVAFLEASTYLCRQETGRFGFIVPLSWQTGIGYTLLRKHLLIETSLSRLINLPFDVFPDAYVDTGILITEVTHATEDHAVQTISFPKNFKSQPEFADHSYKIVLQNQWIEGKGVIVLDPMKLSLLKKVSTADQVNVPLSTLTDSGRGVLARVEDIKDSRPNNKQNWQPFFSGNMSRFDIENPQQYILYGTNLRESPSSFEAFVGKRLLVRRIVNRQDRIMATGEEQTFVTKKDIYFFKTKPGFAYDIGYLTALMNSQLFSFLYLEQDVAATKDDFRQITLDGLRALPIRTIRFELTEAQKSSVTKLIQEYQSSYDNRTFMTQITSWIKSDNSRLVHDCLSFLATKMIDLNRKRRNEVSRFLGSLENTLRVKTDKTKRTIEVLTGFTIIQNYLGDYQKGESELPWEDFYYRLHQNRNRFGVNLGQVKAQIQQEYEKSLATLRPIKQQLAATDALIDQIVYKLYALSDEEVELIERPAYEQALTEAKAKVLQDKKLQEDPEAASEAIAENILPAAKRFQSRVPLQTERTQLDQDLPGWELLPGDVPTFLLSGQYDLATRPDYLDFSAAVVSFAKAVENSIYTRLFIPFRDQSNYSDADCGNKFLKEFMRGQRDLTLGTFPIILAATEPAFRQFVTSHFPDAETRLFSDSGVVGLLQDGTVIHLRNKAAHDELLDREAAETVRTWAVAILQHL